METFEEALRREGDKQYRQYMTGGFLKGHKRDRKLEKRIAHIKRQAEEARSRADELRQRYSGESPEWLKRIEQLRPEPLVLGLKCPECGDVDRHNRKNGKPWCFKCDVALVDASKRVELPNIKVVRAKRHR